MQWERVCRSAPATLSHPDGRSGRSPVPARLPTLALVAATLALHALPARAASPGVCAPPRTTIAVVPLEDHSDGAWRLVTGGDPAQLVAGRLVDSLSVGLGYRVHRLVGREAAPGTPDARALALARRDGAEVVVTGRVTAFDREDRREPGRFVRWGMGAPEASSHVEVAVELRVLDARDGSVILETRAARTRTGRGTASASAPTDEALAAVMDERMQGALGEVLSDLARTIDSRLDSRWVAPVLAERDGRVRLDAGRDQGLFEGARLQVWRSSRPVSDDERYVGAAVVETLEGRRRARLRVVEGEVRVGDLMRPCRAPRGPALTVQR